METQQLKSIYFAVFRNPLWVCATYCTTCRQLMKTYEEALFVFEIGECANCDHNRYSILEDVSSYEESEE